MKKFLIVTCSLSGCTDLIAQEIEKILISKAHEVILTNSDEVTKDQIETSDYILLGTYTYSMNTENDAYIPFELEDFLDVLYKAKPEEKYFGIFGSCDSTYKFYGKALHLLQEDVRSYGGNVMDNVLKIELEPDTQEDIKDCQQFVHQYLKFIK